MNPRILMQLHFIACIAAGILGTLSAMHGLWLVWAVNCILFGVNALGVLKCIKLSHRTITKM
jgi:hypothetical protein